MCGVLAARMPVAQSLVTNYTSTLDHRLSFLSFFFLSRICSTHDKRLGCTNLTDDMLLSPALYHQAGSPRPQFTPEYKFCFTASLCQSVKSGKVSQYSFLTLNSTLICSSRDILSVRGLLSIRTSASIYLPSNKFMPRPAFPQEVSLTD